MTDSMRSRSASVNEIGSPERGFKGRQSRRRSLARQCGREEDGAGSRPALYGRGFAAEGVPGRWVLKRAEVTVAAGDVSGGLSVNEVRARLRARLSAPVSIPDALGG